jgi:hypothetical protein
LRLILSRNRKTSPKGKPDVITKTIYQETWKEGIQEKDFIEGFSWPPYQFAWRAPSAII